MKNEARLYYMMDTRDGIGTGLAEMMTDSQAEFRNDELRKAAAPFLHALVSCVECDSRNAVIVTQAGALCEACRRAYNADINRFNARLERCGIRT